MMFKSFFAFIYLILISFSLVYFFVFNFLSTLEWPARLCKRIVLTENHVRKRCIFIFTRKLHTTITHIYTHTHKNLHTNRNIYILTTRIIHATGARVYAQEATEMVLRTSIYTYIFTYIRTGYNALVRMIARDAREDKKK